MRNKFCLCNILLTILASVLCGCAAQPAPRGLIRSPLDHWESWYIRQLGIRLELPKKSYHPHYRYKEESSYEGDVRRWLTLSLHPIWPGVYLEEPQYNLIVDIERVNQEIFSKRKSGNLIKSLYGDRLNMEDDIYFSKVQEGYFPNKEESRQKEYFVERGFRTRHGYLITFGATINLRMGGTDEQLNEDVAAVHHMLDSIQILE